MAPVEGWHPLPGDPPSPPSPPNDDEAPGFSLVPYSADARYDLLDRKPGHSPSSSVASGSGSGSGSARGSVSEGSVDHLYPHLLAAHNRAASPPLPKAVPLRIKTRSELPPDPHALHALPLDTLKALIEGETDKSRVAKGAGKKKEGRGGTASRSASASLSAQHSLSPAPPSRGLSATPPTSVHARTPRPETAEYEATIADVGDSEGEWRENQEVLLEIIVHPDDGEVGEGEEVIAQGEGGAKKRKRKGNKKKKNKKGKRAGEGTGEGEGEDGAGQGGPSVDDEISEPLSPIVSDISPSLSPSPAPEDDERAVEALVAPPAIVDEVEPDELADDPPVPAHTATITTKNAFLALPTEAGGGAKSKVKRGKKGAKPPPVVVQADAHKVVPEVSSPSIKVQPVVTTGASQPAQPAQVKRERLQAINSGNVDAPSSPVPPIKVDPPKVSVAPDISTPTAERSSDSADRRDTPHPRHGVHNPVSPSGGGWNDVPPSSPNSPSAETGWQTTRSNRGRYNRPQNYAGRGYDHRRFVSSRLPTSEPQYYPQHSPDQAPAKPLKPEPDAELYTLPDGQKVWVLPEVQERPDLDKMIMIKNVPRIPGVTFDVLGLQLRRYFEQHAYGERVYCRIDTREPPSQPGCLVASITVETPERAQEFIHDPAHKSIRMSSAPAPSGMVLEDDENASSYDLVLEPANPSRTIWVHLSDRPIALASRSSPPGLGRRRAVPGFYVFERFLDGSGHYELVPKFRVRARVKLDQPAVSPYKAMHEKERRSQGGNPTSSSAYQPAGETVIRADTGTEEEIVRKLCNVFGGIEWMRPRSDRGIGGFEVCFWDRLSASRARSQFCLLDGVLVSWVPLDVVNGSALAYATASPGLSPSSSPHSYRSLAPQRIAHGINRFHQKPWPAQGQKVGAEDFPALPTLARTGTSDAPAATQDEPPLTPAAAPASLPGDDGLVDSMVPTHSPGIEQGSSSPTASEIGPTGLAESAPSPEPAAPPRPETPAMATAITRSGKPLAIKLPPSRASTPRVVSASPAPPPDASEPPLKASPARISPPEMSAAGEHHIVVISGLDPEKETEETMRSRCLKYGQITACYFGYPDESSAAPTCFISFASIESARLAAQGENGSFVNGRQQIARVPADETGRRLFATPQRETGVPEHDLRAAAQEQKGSPAPPDAGYTPVSPEAKVVAVKIDGVDERKITLSRPPVTTRRQPALRRRASSDPIDARLRDAMQEAENAAVPASVSTPSVPPQAEPGKPAPQAKSVQVKEPVQPEMAPQWATMANSSDDGSLSAVPQPTTSSTAQTMYGTPMTPNSPFPLYGQQLPWYYTGGPAQWVPMPSPPYLSGTSDLHAAPSPRSPPSGEANRSTHPVQQGLPPPPPPLPEQRPSQTGKAPEVPANRPPPTPTVPSQRSQQGAEAPMVPTAFHMSPQGLIMRYDPEQLARYNQQQNVSVYGEASPSAEDTTVPVTLLPLKYGGHSPDELSQKPRNDLLSNPGLAQELLSRPAWGESSYEPAQYGFGVEYQYALPPSYPPDMSTYYQHVDPQYAAYPTTSYAPVMVMQPPAQPVAPAEIPIVARPGSHAATGATVYGVVPPIMLSHGNPGGGGQHGRRGGRGGHASGSRDYQHHKGEQGHHLQPQDMLGEMGGRMPTVPQPHDQALFPTLTQVYPSVTRGGVYGQRPHVGQPRRE